MTDLEGYLDKTSCVQADFDFAMAMNYGLILDSTIS